MERAVEPLSWAMVDRPARPAKITFAEMLIVNDYKALYPVRA
jgi:hypothetical protein